MLAVSPVSSSSSSRRSPRLSRAARAARLAMRAQIVTFVPELQGRALRFARTPEGADDLVQDTLERAFRFEASFEPGTNLRAWLHQILFSVFMTRCRRARRERDAVVGLTGDPCAWTTPEAPMVGVGLSRSVRAALSSMPTMFRKVVMLVDIEERSYKDAAKKLRIPVGTVMSRLHRARKILAEALRAQGIAPEEKLAA